MRRAGDGTIYWLLPAGHLYAQAPRPVLARPLARPVLGLGSAGEPPLPPEAPIPWDSAAAGYAALTYTLRAAQQPAPQVGARTCPKPADKDDDEPPF